MIETFLLMAALATPGVGERKAVAPAAPAAKPNAAAPKGDAAKPEPSEEELARFRGAFQDIEQTTNVQRLTAAMAVLRDSYPLSRSVVVEQAMSGSAKCRTFAIQILGEHGKASDDLPVVTRALKAGRAGTRLAAVMAVRKLGKDGLKDLLAYLPTETVDNNKKMAIKTLQMWEDVAAVPALIQLLGTERDDGVRNFVETALEVLTKERFGKDSERWARYWEEKQRREQAAQLRLMLEEGASHDAPTK